MPRRRDVAKAAGAALFAAGVTGTSTAQAQAPTPPLAEGLGLGAGMSLGQALGIESIPNLHDCGG